MRCVLVTLALLLACGACGGDDGSPPDASGLLDAAPAKDPCVLCARDELCVQRFDGTCGDETTCVTTELRCAPDTCSVACEQAFCARPYQCTNRPPCGTESPNAFRCYGP